ncbi:ABC transporter substrate-binding protein [Martelella sp. AMO21009]
MKPRTALLAILIAGLMTGAATAKDLVIGMKAAVDNADPHQLYTPNRNVDLQVYEPLVYQDRYLRPVPWLATSWKPLDDTTWEFRLREDVKFSNGTPFTAQDVVFSLNRGITIKGLRTYAGYLKDIASVEAKDDHTVIIKTKTPTSMLPWNLTSIGMVSAKAAKDATEEDFNGGSAAIGTGPYRWIKWTPGDSVVLEKNPDYWNGVEPWDKVTYRFIPDDSARVAGLLAGDVDVIDQVPGNLSKQIADSGKTSLVEDTSVFNVYLSFDSVRPNSPFIKANDGSDLKENPFSDPDVREAVNIAINRTGLAERIMNGAAVPTGQLAAEEMQGYVPSLGVPEYDPAKAKELLAKAGYPDGFRMTIHCYNNRFTGDVQTCQAVAAMLTAIGIKTSVDAMPTSVFFKRARANEFSFFMIMYGTPTGSTTSMVTTVLQTVDKENGYGANNNNFYSNPEVDELIMESQSTFDEAESEELLKKATEVAIKDHALLPLFFLKSSWGVRKGLLLEPRADGFTMARNIREQ